MVNMTCSLFVAAIWACFLVTTTVATTTSLQLRGNQEVEPAGKHSFSNWARQLQGPSLTTARCNMIRIEDYQAELQLLYEYEVEFALDSPRSLTSMELLIAHAVVQELDICDEYDRPLYKVKTNARHAFSKDRKLTIDSFDDASRVKLICREMSAHHQPLVLLWRGQGFVCPNPREVRVALSPVLPPFFSTTSRLTFKKKFTALSGPDSTILTFLVSSPQLSFELDF
jgi:hypothetical protein